MGTSASVVMGDDDWNRREEVVRDEDSKKGVNARVIHALDSSSMARDRRIVSFLEETHREREIDDDVREVVDGLSFVIVR